MRARLMNKPGLVATLGPASKGREAELAAAGATQFRINASHLNERGLRAYIESAGERAPRVPIVVDLQGAKMRLGNFEPRAVARADVLTLVPADTTHTIELPLPHPEAFQALRVGDLISIDDGRLRGSIVSVAPQRLQCKFMNDGLLQPRKGFNRADHPLTLDDLTPRDQQLALVATAAGCRHFALSFVADGRECQWLRRLADVRVTAKIERRDALSQLARIAEHADAIWICRGDLGAQLGLQALGQAVAAIIPHPYSVPLWMAGQVLEHLTAHRDPTRSEVCHLYDLMTRGYAGIVLSDETAIGIDPVNAVAAARALLDSAA